MSTDLQNIPGVWTGIFHWLAYGLYLGLLPRKQGKWACAAVLLVLLAVQVPYAAVSALLEGMQFNLSMIAFAAITLLPFALLTQGTLASDIYYCARAFILGGFSVSLAWQLVVYYRQFVPFLQTPLGETAGMLLVEAVVLAVMFWLERSHRREMREMPVPAKAGWAVLLMAVIIYILSSLSYTTLDSPFTTDKAAEAFNIRTLVYLGGVAILYAYHLQLCDSYALRELSALQNIMEVQYAGFQQSRESIELVNQKYHDLKHQIALLREEIGTSAKLECLDQMEREIREYEGRPRTGNEVLDAVIARKSSTCLDRGITLTVAADGEALGFISVMDLSNLFGNAVDNAIEAVSQLERPEQRLIELTVGTQQGFLRIRVSNCCRESLSIQGGLPQTTKADASQHGYGLKSIRATAEKYGGSMTVQAENGWFVLGVLIPLPAGTSAAAAAHGVPAA